jgi:DNA-binding beta-propeller fold protein YncE
MRRFVVTCLVYVAACGAPNARAPKVPEAPTAAVDFIHASCARVGKTALPTREEDARQGSAVVLARSEKLLAYVADADSHSIHTVSIGDKRELGHTNLGATPKQLVVLPDGRVVVTLVDAGRIAVLEPGENGTMAKLCEREAPDEPWGIALSPDDSKLVVTSAWAATLTTFDTTAFAAHSVVALPRDPRSVLVDDADVAFVAHLVGAQMSAVKLENESPLAIDLSLQKSTPLARRENMTVHRTGSQGFAIARATLSSGKAKSERIFAPMVSVDPGDPERRSAIYYGPPFDGVPKETPTVIVVDPAEKQSLSKYVLGTSQKQFRRECVLPRAAVVRGETLLVTCFGIDAVLELDALGADPFRAEKRRFGVPPGPEGIAVDAPGKRAIVFSQLGGALSVIALEEGKAMLPEIIALDYRPDPALAAVAHGRQMFYRTDDPRITDDGLACSSCHIDGRDDGITWTTPTGGRQTPMLAGRLGKTSPYGWEGTSKTVDAYIKNTVSNLGGHGLDDSELEALSRFLLSTKGPHVTAAADVERGRQLFDQGCSSCHVGGMTDSTLHGFGGADSMRADTPSLQFVRGTAPYFHDGRYKTLEALLADPGSIMGQSALLPASDRAALAAYLRTL